MADLSYVLCQQEHHGRHPMFHSRPRLTATFAAGEYRRRRRHGRSTALVAVLAIAVAGGCSTTGHPVPPQVSASSPAATTSSPAPSRLPHAGTEEPAIVPLAWAGIHQRLAGLDADVTMLAARIGEGGTCEPIASVDATANRPMASIFKLYVLEAVADAVAAGRISWDDPLTVTEDLRSLPSGELQDRPGARVTVEQAAAFMIAISDNTAAELLIDLVGREAVEAARTELGGPAAEPFLTTREYFTLGWGRPELRDDWRDAGERGRRAILGALPGGPLTITGSDITDPVWRFGLDWFGSATDVCAAMVALTDDDAAEASVLRPVLGGSRGVLADEAQWPYVAFKGGNAPGVVTGAWYGERSDGERYVFVLQTASAEATELADMAGLFSLAGNAFAIFSRQ